jgi:hypothetical protein
MIVERFGDAAWKQRGFSPEPPEQAATAPLAG